MSHQPEIELLIACALPPSHPQIGDRVRSSAGSPIDWNKLSEFAAYHRVQPLLYARLAEHAPSALPENVLAELNARYRAGATRNLNLTGELMSLAKAFTEAGIPILPHKGPLLALAAYGDLAMRQFADLDILIHPSDLARTITLLGDAGYRVAEDLAWLSPSALLRWTGEMSYISQRGLSVDLHWRLTPSHYTVQLDPEILWQSGTVVTIAGTELPTLSPAALVLLLAVHGAKHCWEAIGWLADVAWLLDANPTLDWGNLTELARASNCERPLRLALSLVQQLFEARVPNLGVDPAAARLHRRVLKRLYCGAAESPASPELFSFATGLADGRCAALRHLLGVIFYPTEIDWGARQLPESVFWRYVPARTARLCGKYLFRRISKAPAP